MDNAVKELEKEFAAIANQPIRSDLSHFDPRHKYFLSKAFQSYNLISL